MALHPIPNSIPLTYSTPLFGFAFFDDNKWWIHSWSWHGDFLLDSCRKPATVFWGMPWDVWLFQALFPSEALSPILCKRGERIQKTQVPVLSDSGNLRGVEST